jgi:hypothetical protein
MKKLDYKLTSEVVDLCASHLYSLECYDYFHEREDEVQRCIDMVQNVLRKLSKEMMEEDKKCHT